MRLRTAAKNRIQAQLAGEGIPVGVGLWTHAGAEWLEGVELSVIHRWTGADCEALIGVPKQRITALEAEIRRQAKPHPAGRGAPGHPRHRPALSHDAGGRDR